MNTKYFFTNRYIRCKLFGIIISVLLCTLVLLTCWGRNNNLDGRKCFGDRNLGEKLEETKLPDIMLNKRKPTPGKTIFFHETSCSKAGILKLNARQACAIESAALLNPNFDIFVLFASPTSQSNQSLTEDEIGILEAVFTYKNIYFRNVNLWSYAFDTPIYEWLKDGQIFNSNYMLSHTSDFLRFLTLWRWGGTYLDLDVVVQKSLENLLPNYAGAESENFIAAGVINLDSKGFGHDIADLCLQDFQQNFDGDDWGNNGPGVITRVLQKICKTKVPYLMTRARCFGFNVYNKTVFYAVQWWNWKHFFEQKYFESTIKLTRDSFAIHVWNKHSIKGEIKVGSKVAYGVIAEKYCPRVYNSCGEYF